MSDFRTVVDGASYISGTAGSFWLFAYDYRLFRLYYNYGRFRPLEKYNRHNRTEYTAKWSDLLHQKLDLDHNSMHGPIGARTKVRNERRILWLSPLQVPALPKTSASEQPCTKRRCTTG